MQDSNIFLLYTLRASPSPRKVLLCHYRDRLNNQQIYHWELITHAPKKLKSFLILIFFFFFLVLLALAALRQTTAESRMCNVESQLTFRYSDCNLSDIVGWTGQATFSTRVYSHFPLPKYDPRQCWPSQAGNAHMHKRNMYMHKYT